MHQPGAYGLSDRSWRLVHYLNGDEELYDTDNDPHEWNNLATNPEYDSRRERLRRLAPTEFAVAPKPTIDALAELPWHALKKDALAPASNPDGREFDVVFINRSRQTVRLWWMDRTAQPKPYETIGAGQQLRRKSRPGAVWMIRDESGRNLGFFRVDDRSAKAIIP
ncbi:MAG: hypothetical protein B7Z55_09680 [Planctomycetales bacterium 12-60-4]|nr:MAG: hypothetical protein B7Z55_09680 [Planctomycetales bacterium 12-60-4]